MNRSAEQEFHVSPEQYSQILDKKYELSSVRQDGTINYDRFTAWLIGEHGFKPYNSYKLVVDFPRYLRH